MERRPVESDISIYRYTYLLEVRSTQHFTDGLHESVANDDGDVTSRVADSEHLLI